MQEKEIGAVGRLRQTSASHACPPSRTQKQSIPDDSQEDISGCYSFKYIAIPSSFPDSNQSIPDDIAAKILRQSSASNASPFPPTRLKEEHSGRKDLWFRQDDTAEHSALRLRLKPEHTRRHSNKDSASRQSMPDDTSKMMLQDTTASSTIRQPQQHSTLRLRANAEHPSNIAIKILRQSSASNAFLPA